jgi:hypothetical protein
MVGPTRSLDGSLAAVAGGAELFVVLLVVLEG